MRHLRGHYCIVCVCVYRIHGYTDFTARVLIVYENVAIVNVRVCIRRPVITQLMTGVKLCVYNVVYHTFKSQCRSDN